MTDKTRTRIAPSPTGFLHIGTARTALFNYLFAKKNQGSFILRIEDTDLERSNVKFEEDIMESLKWLGIEWSEGPDIGGDFGPYRQSQKVDNYTKYLEKLLNEGKAYYCFCTEEELEAQREYAMSIGQSWHYNGKCAQLSKEEVKKMMAEGKSSIIRFRAPVKKVKFNDLIRGEIEFDADLIGDFSLAKDLKTPLYNFAVVVDDFEMEISHIIRGEDHLSNTPKQILIQEALGFPQPEYAHLPLILDQDRKKMSKRQGTIAIAEYKKEGFLPEALVNFMAFLGWNPGTEREIYAMPSLIKDFSLENIQKGGAVFNIKKLESLNGFYIRQKSIEKLTELCIPYLIGANLLKSHEEKEKFHLGKPHFEIIATKEIIELSVLEKIVGLYQERLKKLSEISELIDFFFKDKLEYDKSLLKWGEMTDKEIYQSLDKLEKIFDKIKDSDWKKEELEKQIMPEAEKMGDRGQLLWPFRVVLTGKEASAGPFEIAEILGKEKIIERLKWGRGLLK
jgi:nondiscriminating glutamyl-tRNA synthetase